MKKPIIKFIIKLFFFCLPVVLLLFFYMATDPFKVLYSYDNYCVPGKNAYVVLNKDYISTETFLKKYPEYKYDSFIFGSSRSCFFQVKDWEHYINSKKCFHFDASNESLYGIHAKLNFINQKKIPIKNVLLVLDRDLLAVTVNNPGHLFTKHPRLSGQNQLLFQMEFVKAFFDKQFLYEYTFFWLTGKIEKNVMNGGLLNDGPVEYDPITNETRLGYYEKMINENPNSYYLGRKPPFFKRNAVEKMHYPIIKNDQKRLLKEIYAILSHNRTTYRVIISPLYDQINFNNEDYRYLSEIFGSKNVYNFSGINKITNNIINYYDYSHYRPHVAKYILNVIYK